MTYAMMTESVNGAHEVVLRRESHNKIIVSTLKDLSDKQMQDLYWVILLMQRSGLTLKEILGSQSN